MVPLKLLRVGSVFEGKPVMETQPQSGPRPTKQESGPRPAKPVSSKERGCGIGRVNGTI